MRCLHFGLIGLLQVAGRVASGNDLGISLRQHLLAALGRCALSALRRSSALIATAPLIRCGLVFHFVLQEVLSYETKTI